MSVPQGPVLAGVNLPVDGHWPNSWMPRRGHRHALEPLAQCFDVVEVGSSFQSNLRPEVSRLWIHKVEANRNFQFTVKLHRAFTHDRLLETEAVKAWKEGLWPLLHAKKLGCVLMQFPWSFRFTAENREFFIRLRRTFHEFPLVAEMRHSSWMLDEALGTFIDYRVGFCNIDQPRFTKAMPPTAFLTSGLGYVRLHGRNCWKWYEREQRQEPRQRYDYLYPENELDEWRERVEQIRAHASNVFVVMNNGAGAKPAYNALQFQALYQGENLLQREMSGRLYRDLLRQPAGLQNTLFREYAGSAVA